MQSGKVKHYNKDKGYGFIKVDDHDDLNHQSEDVFFHISNWQLSVPPQVGQTIYFNCKRNNKNQLRATVVAANPNYRHLQTHNTARTPSKHTQTNGSLVTNIVGILAIILVGYFLLTRTDLLNFESPSSISTFSHQDTYIQINHENPTNSTSINAVTGDPDVDNTIYLIKQGGPFPYPHKDGTTFYNREGRLPPKNRNYYHEYTVPTPGVSHRGARRIVTGGNPPTEYYFTDDHYESFTLLQVN